MLMKIVLHMRFHVNATFRSRFACLAVFCTVTTQHPSLNASNEMLKFRIEDIFKRLHNLPRIGFRARF